MLQQVLTHKFSYGVGTSSVRPITYSYYPYGVYWGFRRSSPLKVLQRRHWHLLTVVSTERLAKLDLHQGFVKGVCWDPVGEFLATQSDDRTVRIWRTTDWQLQETVTKPFEHSPGSTFFRRLRCALFSFVF